MTWHKDGQKIETESWQANLNNKYIYIHAFLPEALEENFQHTQTIYFLFKQFYFLYVYKGILQNLFLQFYISKDCVMSMSSTVEKSRNL